MIHPTAQIDPACELGEAVEVGAFTILGPEVRIGDGTVIGSHVVIEGPTEIGTENRISSFCSLGGPPQDKKYAGENTCLVIGNRNTIREYCTFNRGTAQGGGTTRLGDDNWIMAYVHLAHDCQVGSEVIFANCATLAGHVTVEDRVTLGAFTVVHQFCSIGRHAFTAMGTVVLKDLPPYVTASGNSAEAHGINTEGLRRAGFASDTIRALRRAYKIVYRQRLTVEQAIETLRGDHADEEAVMVLAEFIGRSTRGIVR